MKLIWPELTIEGTARVVYEREGKPYIGTAEPSFDENGLRAERTVTALPDGYRVDVKLHNTGDMPVRVRRVASLTVDRRALISWGSTWKEWDVLCQGRHKNDIPSVVTLGLRDDRMADLAGGMNETGDAASGGELREAARSG